MPFTSEESQACEKLLTLALEEDLGKVGDLTGDSVIPEEMKGQADFVARKPGILAGLPVIECLLQMTKDELSFTPTMKDGEALQPGSLIGQIQGSMRGILRYERTLLNFLQRLCGVATLTRTYVDAVAGIKTVILDTRKTTPGWRLLEKYAVRCGGGTNHRMGLYDGVMIKDNHLAAMKGTDAIRRTVELARQGTSKISQVSIELEVDTLEQLDEALQARPDIILLDNMPPEMLREAKSRRDRVAPDVLLEASGGINLTTIRGIAETGVDRISIGALTHSAIALDIGLDYHLT